MGLGDLSGNRKAQSGAAIYAGTGFIGAVEALKQVRDVLGQQIFDVLAAKEREGVEVRLEVDALGSEINLGSQELYRGLRAAGIETVANHPVPIDRLMPPVVGGDRGRIADLVLTLFLIRITDQG